MCTLKNILMSVFGLLFLSSSSILCNILLLLKGKITGEVKLSGGFVGGLTALVPALFQKGSLLNWCCGACFGKCQAVLLEAFGVCGAAYNFGATSYGLISGLHCDEGVCSYKAVLFYVQMVVSGVKIIFTSFRCLCHICCKGSGGPASSSA